MKSQTTEIESKWQNGFVLLLLSLPMTHYSIARQKKAESLPHAVKRFHVIWSHATKFRGHRAAEAAQIAQAVPVTERGGCRGALTRVLRLL